MSGEGAGGHVCVCVVGHNYQRVFYFQYPCFDDLAFLQFLDLHLTTWQYGIPAKQKQGWLLSLSQSRRKHRVIFTLFLPTSISFAFWPQRINSPGHLKSIWYLRSRCKVIGVIVLPHNLPYLESFCKRVLSLLLIQIN